jgi:nitrogen fixation/metabolism regulation signal transduction histidine kinase
MECLEIADFGVSFSTDGQGPMEQRLMESINLSMRKLRLRLSKREEKYQYIGTLLDTVDTSMMVVDHEGQVVWMNRASVK